MMLIHGFLRVVVLDYFQGLTEVLLYLILPQDVYNCAPTGLLAQDLLVNHVFIPVLAKLSDPDFVNQTIIWLVSPCSSIPGPMPPEINEPLIHCFDSSVKISQSRPKFT